MHGQFRWTLSVLKLNNQTKTSHPFSNLLHLHAHYRAASAWTQLTGTPCPDWLALGCRFVCLYRAYGGLRDQSNSLEHALTAT